MKHDCPTCMCDVTPGRQGGPWTTHGHAIRGVTVEGPGRPRVARCGGPGLCRQCSREALAEQMRVPAGNDRRFA